MNIDISEAKKLVFETPDGGSTYVKTDEDCYPDTKVSGLIVSDNAYNDDDPFFIFFISDCAFPPFYVVRGRSFEDAYEAFIDDCVERKDAGILLDWKDPEHVKDYGLETDNPSCNFSSDGTPVNTEAVQGFEIELKAVEF
jgi:hypothetical protein